MDETDLQIVNLLQIDPRISWAQAGQILGISATTASHRWHRMSEEGLAWITTFPNPALQFSAIVEVDCRTEYLPPVIAALCDHPLVVSVDEATGERDLLLTIIAPDMDTLTRLIVDWIGGLEGVYGSRTSLITEVLVGSEEWRVRALSAQQAQDAVPHLSSERAGRNGHEIDRALAQALARDGRRSVASLAEEVDQSTSSVHRRLQRLRATGQIRMRCDVAPEVAGWQLECTWLATVALSHKQRIVELLRGHPALRSCLWITGANNLRLNLRIAHHSAMTRVEDSVAASIPGLAPAETIIHLRSHKSMGWRLTNRGRVSGEVVVPSFGG